MRPTLSPWAPHAPRIRHPYRRSLGKYEPSPVAVALGSDSPFLVGLFGPQVSLATQASSYAGAYAGATTQPPPLPSLAEAKRQQEAAYQKYIVPAFKPEERVGLGPFGSLDATSDLSVRMGKRAYAQEFNNLYSARIDYDNARQTPEQKAASAAVYTDIERSMLYAGSVAQSVGDNDLFVIAQVWNGGMVGEQITPSGYAEPQWFSEVKTWVKWGSLGGAVLLAVVVASFLLPKG